jgi:hypothetical protein
LALPPYVIYKASRLYAQWCPKNIIKGVVYNGTKSGWTDQDCFFDYLNKLFIPNTKNIEKPLLMIFDGHYSHLSIKAVRLAIQHNIHLLCLPSHSTHILQPLDIYTLKYVKQQWKQLLWDRHKSSSTPIEKREFIELFGKLYDYALIPGHCSTAFAKAGIYPYDPRVINNDRIVKNMLAKIPPPPPRQLSQTFNECDISTCSNDGAITDGKKRIRSSSAPDILSSNFPIHFVNNYLILSLPDVFANSTNSEQLAAQTQVDDDTTGSLTTTAYQLLDNVLDQTRDFQSTTANNEQLSPFQSIPYPSQLTPSLLSNTHSDLSPSSDNSTHTSNYLNSFE